MLRWVLIFAIAFAGSERTLDAQFNTTAGWRSYRGMEFPRTGWVVDNGCIRHVAGSGGGDIITRQQFADFELELDWKVAPGGNSGILYRIAEVGEESWHTGPEMQILDNQRHSDGKNPLTSAGALYGLIAPTKNVTKPAGESNHVRLVVIGNHVEHWLNGEKILEYEFNSPDLKSRIAKSKFKNFAGFAKQKIGHIALQDHSDDVTFCNIAIREVSR
jgi:3-keto-disaccharide hydrolase